jgi:uncharacterized protein (TIGR03435 family)
MTPSKPVRQSCIVAAVLGLISTLPAQTPAKPIRLTFDVASVRASSPDARGGQVKPLPGGTGYTVQNIPVKLMISLMYKVPMRQITGAPEWLTSQNYDIEARADGAYNIDDLHTMFQNLLADRFSLKFHKETREGPVYVLSLDPAGLKMKADGDGQGLAIPMIPGADNTITGTKVPMVYFTWWLGQQLQNDSRPVIDRTGLKGSFDFTLSFMPQLPPDVPKDSLPQELRDRPSLFDAVKQQLGLKLEAQRGPVDYYVIDHVDKPSDN